MILTVIYDKETGIYTANFVNIESSEIATVRYGNLETLLNALKDHLIDCEKMLKIKTQKKA